MAGKEEGESGKGSRRRARGLQVRSFGHWDERFNPSFTCNIYSRKREDSKILYGAGVNMRQSR